MQDVLMVELNNIDKNFFVIDSENLDDINTELYGYAISQNQILTADDLEGNISVDGTGAYVYISVINDEINIYQDINGCFGIYIYNNDHYFAISNSFIMLVNHIKDKYELTLNHDYSVSFLTSDVCSYDIDETLINEIYILPRNYIINIDKSKKEIYYKEIDYEENTLSLNSFEGIKTLDEWYYKWENILTNLYKTTDNISFDLSGGMDSRGIISLLFSSDIDYQQFNINSHVGDKPNFIVAKEIADDFNITLNKDLNVEYNYLSDLDSYFKPSILTKLGSIKLLFPTSKIPTEPIYKFTGFGGGCIRGFPRVSAEAHARFIYQNAKKYSQEYGDLLKEKDEKNLKKLNEIYSPKKIDDLPALAHKEVRSRYIHGQTMIEKFCSNYIYLAPYLDPLLYKLKINDDNCLDKNLLITIIYDRYYSQLLDYPFDSGRKIEEDTIKYAKFINEKYPFIKNENLLNTPKKLPLNQNTKYSQDENKNLKKTKTINYECIRKFLYEIYTTPTFKNTFKKYFSENIYRKGLGDLEKKDGTIVSIRDVFSVIAVVMTIMDVEYSRNTDNPLTLLKKFLDNKTYTEYESDLKIGKLSLKIPEDFWINSDNSITNGSITLSFKIVGKSDNRSINERVDRYIELIKEDDGQPQRDSFNINNMQVQKVKNIKLNTTRYWFEKNNIIYLIYTYSKDNYIDGIVKYILNSINDVKITIGNLMFTLPPKYWIRDSESITNGKATFFFKFTPNSEDNLNALIESYKKHIKHEKGEIQEEFINMNNIEAQKIKNTKSYTTRCWFEKNGIIYQIFSYSKEDNVDDNIRFLIKNLE